MGLFSTYAPQVDARVNACSWTCAAYAENRKEGLSERPARARRKTTEWII